MSLVVLIYDSDGFVILLTFVQVRSVALSVYRSKYITSLLTKAVICYLDLGLRL